MCASKWFIYQRCENELIVCFLSLTLRTFNRVSGHNKKTSSTTFIRFLVFHYFCSTNAYSLVIIKNSFYIFFFYNDSSYSDCAILTAVIGNSRSLNCFTYLHQHALISVVSLKPIGKNFIRSTSSDIILNLGFILVYY